MRIIIFLIPIILFLCVLCLILGLINPAIVIRWGEKSKATRKKVLLYYGSATFVFFILFSLFVPVISV